jgi:hypothetical protein
MNFVLDHFELHLPPDNIPLGEQLFDRNSVVHYEEIERNLWSFEVKDGNLYEIEILISPSKVLNFSCDCETYKQSGHCRHIVACLYQLRLLKTKKISKGPRIVRSVPKKLNIPNLLTQIESEELKSFVRNYARKDKKFSTALKANFARKIELENNEEKYEGILSSIIRPATGVDYSISSPNIKQFLNVAEQFDAQYEDSLSLKQYTEAFFIIKALLGKVAYINHWKKSEHEPILNASKHFHKQFRLLLEMEIAPSLERQMVEFGLELAARSYYHIAHAEQNLLLILLDPLTLESKEGKLVSLLENKIASSLLHDYELENLWTIRQYFVEKGINITELKAPQLSSHSVYRIADRLFEFKAYEGLRNFLELFIVNGQIRDIYLVKLYLKVLKIKDEKEKLTSIAMSNLFVHKDIFFYRLLKDSYPDTDEDLFKKVTQKLATKHTLENQKLYLSILKEDERVDELIEYLKSSKHALIHIYEQAEFIANNSRRLTEVLIQLSDTYLKEYLGAESSVEMKKLLLFLRKNKWEKELSKLQKHLLKDYEDRKSLTLEIRDV